MILSTIGTKGKRLDIYKKMKTTKKLIKLLIFLLSMFGGFIIIGIGYYILAGIR